MLYERCARLFQFHKGTIRTMQISFLRLKHTYFNSIKVQLEHLNYAQAKNAYANFNSIKVQLEQPTD